MLLNRVGVLPPSRNRKLPVLRRHTSPQPCHVARYISTNGTAGLPLGRLRGLFNWYVNRKVRKRVEFIRVSLEEKWGSVPEEDILNAFTAMPLVDATNILDLKSVIPEFDVNAIQTADADTIKQRAIRLYLLNGPTKEFHGSLYIQFKVKDCVERINQEWIFRGSDKRIIVDWPSIDAMSRTDDKPIQEESDKPQLLRYMDFIKSPKLQIVFQLYFLPTAALILIILTLFFTGIASLSVETICKLPVADNWPIIPRLSAIEEEIKLSCDDFSSRLQELLDVTRQTIGRARPLYQLISGRYLLPVTRDYDLFTPLTSLYLDLLHVANSLFVRPVYAIMDYEQHGFVLWYHWLLNVATLGGTGGPSDDVYDMLRVATDSSLNADEKEAIRKRVRDPYTAGYKMDSASLYNWIEKSDCKSLDYDEMVN